MNKPTPILTKSTQQTSKPIYADGLRKKEYRVKRPRISVKDPAAKIPEVTVDKDGKSGSTII